jgi:hypothetical protein
MPRINGYFVMDDSYYTDSDFHILTYNKLQAPPELGIHSNSAAAQLGLTPEELTPILQELQQDSEYLQYEHAQPLPNLTRPTIHVNSATTQLGLITEDIADILEDQEQWLREEGERRYDSGGHNIAGTHHCQQQGRNDIARPQSTPPPFVHPESTATQLRLTPEEAKEVQEECIRAQEEIRQEMEVDDRATREWKAKRDIHEAYDTTNDPDTSTMSFGCDSEHGGDEPHGSLFAYFRIFTPFADNHVIASHVTGITQPIPTFADHFRSFATICDVFRSFAMIFSHLR